MEGRGLGGAGRGAGDLPLAEPCLPPELVTPFVHGESKAQRRQAALTRVALCAKSCQTRI